jgi:nucleoside-diphosphate-sugar epimerase
LRLPGLFGPPRHGGLVYALCEAIINGKTPALPNKPIMWAAMHVDDAADVVARSALHHPGNSLIANVGYPDAQSISSLVRLLAELGGAEISYDVPHPKFQMNLSVLASTFGLPSRGLRERLAEMLEYARQSLSRGRPSLAAEMR